MPAQWQEFPLTGPTYESSDEVQLDQWAAEIVDMVPVVVEGKLQLLKRPGLNELFDLGTSLSVDGMYWWDKQEVVLMVSGGRVWKLDDPNGTPTEITGSTALRTNAIVSFADDGTRCVMANGANMVHTDLATLTTMADAQAPTQVSHVAYIDQYLLAMVDGTGRIQFSNVADPLSWPASYLFSAEARPDTGSVMKEGFREVAVVGRESVEFWYNDGTTPFSRIPGSAQPYGISAPNSLVLVGSTWMWLSDKRQFVTMNGRQVVPVSSPYDQVMHSYTAVDDAVGYTVNINGFPIYVLNFPTARRTLAYNYQTQQWHKWGYWDSQAATYQRFRGQAYCYARSWNMHLVGDYDSGVVYEASREYHTDEGNPIRSLIRTGAVSHSNEVRKVSNILRLRCKRGAGNATVPNPQVMMRQRINNKAAWSNERWKSLGMVGQHELTIDWRRNGIYRTVQREFVHTDDSDFIVVGAKEEIEFLES